MSKTTMLKDALEERANLAEQLKTMWTEADARPVEERALTGEETSKQEQMTARIGDLDLRMKELANDLDVADTVGAALDGFPDVDNGGSTLVQEMRALGEHIVSGTADEYEIERRSLGVDTLTANSAGDTVPTNLEAMVWPLIRERSSILSSGARVMNSPTGVNVTLTKKTASSSATWIQEGTTIGRTKPTVDKITLSKKKLAAIIPVTTEWTRDTALDAAQFLIEDGTDELVDESNAGFVSGAGNADEPQGVDNAAVGATLGGGAFTFDKALELIHSTKPSARRGSIFMFEDALMLAARTIKDNDGRYMWQPSLQIGQPDSLFGYGMFSEPSLGQIADGAGTKIGVFGNMRGFVIRRIGGIRVKRDESIYFETDEVGYRFILECDSAVRDDTIIKTLEA